MSICQFQYSVISCAIYLHRCSHAPYQYLGNWQFLNSNWFWWCLFFSGKIRGARIQGKVLFWEVWWRRVKIDWWYSERCRKLSVITKTIFITIFHILDINWSIIQSFYYWISSVCFRGSSCCLNFTINLFLNWFPYCHRLSIHI